MGARESIFLDANDNWFSELGFGLTKGFADNE